MNPHVIAAARKRIDFTQPQLASFLGTSARVVRRWEAGEQLVPSSVSKLLAVMIVNKIGAMEIIDIERRASKELNQDD